jgi:hypothetical protein
MVELKCDICGKTFKRKPCKINRAEKHYCSNVCRYEGQGLPRHLSWVKDGVVHLEITEGNIVLLDEIDRDLADLNWQTRKGYAARKDKERRHIYMHRLIIERKLGRPLTDMEKVDHHNSNKLDNRRDNIDISTPQENGANTMKPKRNNANKKATSRYKGVHFDKASGKWRARITHGYQTTSLGCFESEEEAATAYDLAAIDLFENFAKLNFPDRWYALKSHKKNGCAYRAEA